MNAMIELTPRLNQESEQPDASNSLRVADGDPGRVGNCSTRLPACTALLTSPTASGRAAFRLFLSLDFSCDEGIPTQDQGPSHAILSSQRGSLRSNIAFFDQNHI
eukprot:scpid53692/ scgid25597/ 